MCHLFSSSFGTRLSKNCKEVKLGNKETQGPYFMTEFFRGIYISMKFNYSQV